MSTTLIKQIICEDCVHRGCDPDGPYCARTGLYTHREREKKEGRCGPTAIYFDPLTKANLIKHGYRVPKGMK